MYIFMLLTLIITSLSAQNVGDKLEDIGDKNQFNPVVLSARMYDYTTETVAYKDKLSKICYIQRIQKNARLPLYISKTASDEKEVETLAGKGIKRFCTGLPVYKLLVPVRSKSKSI